VVLLKTFVFSKGIEKDINIVISKNIINNIIKKHDNTYGSFIILDTKLRNIIKIKNDHTYIKGGEEAKSLDKYLYLCELINNKKYNNIIAIGGGNVLDIVGYAFNTLNFEKNNLILIPSTLSSFVNLPLSGNFYANMNFTRNYLKVTGYPNYIYIDQNFLNYFNTQELKKQFLIPYIIGLLYDKNHSKLSIKYSSSFENLDYDNFLERNIKYIIDFYNHEYTFPGEKISKLIFKESDLLKMDYLEFLAVSFLFLIYISYNKKEISKEKYEEIKNDILKLNILKRDNLKKISFQNTNSTLKEIFITENGYKEFILSNSDIKDNILDFKQII
jgi:3-dehydroquinate synthase